MIISKENYDKRIKNAADEAVMEDRRMTQKFDTIDRRLEFLERAVQRIESRVLDIEKKQLEAMMQEVINKNQKGEEKND